MLTENFAETPGPAPRADAPPAWGWHSVPHPVFRQWHLIPLMDIYAHYYDDCPCGAFMDVPHSVVHQAWDGRQEYEKGTRKRH